MKTYQKRNRIYYIGALISILISTAFAVSLQFFKGDVLDLAIAGEMQATLKYAILLITFILCEVLFHFIYAWFTAKFVTGCTKLLKRDVFKSILQQSYVSYKDHPQGEYISKYTNEVDTIKECRFKMLPLFWEILFKIIFVSVALFVLDWRIAIITLVLLTTPLYLPKLIEKPLQNVQSAQIKSVETALAKVNDWLGGFEIIKNFSVEQKIMQKFDDVNDCSIDKMLHNTTLGAVAQLITTLMSYLSYFIVLACSTWLVLKGDFSAGDFFVAIGMVDQLSYPLIMLANIIRQLISIKPACQSMEQFITTHEGEENTTTLAAVNSEIQYHNVSFSYPGSVQPILQNVNFSAQKGGRYLLKGPSGCGKTTAVNLLLRYYNVDSGEITIDGTPISKFGSTYDCMTVVRQEAILFHDSLRNNLTMYQNIPDEELFRILNSLGLQKFATKDALDTQITENGSNLSGGEKKRICLARALLRDTDVLILDEPLANLDDATAFKIEDLLLSIKNKLVLVVSHQFTPSKLAQFDAVIDFEKH